MVHQQRTEDILGYQVFSGSSSACVALAEEWLISGETGRFFACANPHSLEVARNDPDFRSALLGADLLSADGVGILIASRLMGGTLRERVTGFDMFMGVSQVLERTKGSVFFLGSTEETLAKIRERIAVDYPSIRVLGTYSPPFRDEFDAEDDRAMVDAINTAAPDVLWVGMTAPKQEKWIHRNKARLDVGFVGAIGAVFDYYTGNVKRPGPVFQKLGLEWLLRQIQDPKRFWRRALVTQPSFLMRVLALSARRRLLG
jgi:N-acetylglucosaminyldiphosphoundecaprenol N-acetyl-beta-D-mannosaminyltransferase